MEGEIHASDLGVAPSSRDVLDVGIYRRLRSTLGDACPWSFDDLPMPAIWAYFSTTAATQELRNDGHPSPDKVGPLESLDRRMFVGGSLSRNGKLRLGQAVDRRSRVVSAEEKVGTSGPFLLVEVRHDYLVDDRVVMQEVQNLLYRRGGDGPGQVGSPNSGGPASSPNWRMSMSPNPPLLFRYSAVTFNSHRIHYDAQYATEEEGYPGLVVQGPLTATLLYGLAAQQLAANPMQFRFRATAPTYSGVELHLLADCPGQDTCELQAVRSDGVQVMTATAVR